MESKSVKSHWSARNERVNETLSSVGLAELRVARLSVDDALLELEDGILERRVVHNFPSPDRAGEPRSFPVVTCPPLSVQS